MHLPQLAWPLCSSSVPQTARVPHPRQPVPRPWDELRHFQHRLAGKGMCSSRCSPSLQALQSPVPAGSGAEPVPQGPAPKTEGPRAPSLPKPKPRGKQVPIPHSPPLRTCFAAAGSSGQGGCIGHSGEKHRLSKRKKG